MTQITDVFETVLSRFDKDKMADLTATVVFDLTGEGGGLYHLAIDGGDISYGEGGADDPAATITMEAEDYIAMSQGDLNPMMAFMSGKIKVAGDMGTVMKLQSLLGG